MFGVHCQAAHMNVGAYPVFAKDIGHMRPKRPPVSERQQNPRTDLLGQIDPSSLNLLIRQSRRHRHRDTLPPNHHTQSRQSHASHQSRSHDSVTSIHTSGLPSTPPASARTGVRRSGPFWYRAASQATDAPAPQSGPSSPAVQYQPARAGPAAGGSAPNFPASQRIPSSPDQPFDLAPASAK